MPLPDHVIVTDFDRKQVRADICLDVTYEELLEIDHTWSEEIRVANESLAAQGNPRLSFTGWQWRYKHDFLGPGASMIALKIGGQIEGIIDVRVPVQDSESTPLLGVHARHEGAEIAYVEHVQSAPWNSKALCEIRGMNVRYRGIGEALIEVAVLLSREAGCGGRVLLFALPEAENFYDLLGLYRLGRERLLNNNMRYEFTIESADSFLVRQNKRRNDEK